MVNMRDEGIYFNKVNKEEKSCRDIQMRLLRYKSAQIMYVPPGGIHLR